MNRINNQQIFNYAKIQRKWIGIIDYRLAVADCIYIFAIWKLLSFFNIGVIAFIELFAILLLPAITLTIISIQYDDIVDIVIYMLKFICYRKAYVYKKEYKISCCIYKKNVKK